MLPSDNGNADETIIVRFITDIGKATDDALKFRQEVDQAKKAILELGQSTKVSFTEAAGALRRTAKEANATTIGFDMRRYNEALSRAVAEIAQGLANAGTISKTQLREIMADLNQQAISYSNVMKSIEAEEKQRWAEAVAQEKKALADMDAARKQYAQARTAEAKQNAVLAETLAKEELARARASIQERIANEKQYTMWQKANQEVLEKEEKERWATALAEEKKALAEMEAAQKAYQQRIAAENADMVRSREANMKQQIAAEQYLAKAQLDASKTTKSAFGQVVNNLKSMFSLTNLVTGAFVALGLSVAQVFRNILNYLVEATKAGYEFTKALFQLEVGVRALQRSGLDITLKEIYQNMDRLRTSYKFFTQKELVAGSAQFLNLVRDLGLTKEQIFELQDAMATLAIVNGRSMEEVQSMVARALSSGYTEGLQQLGLSINRVTTAEKAARMGWTQGYTALTEYQRSQAMTAQVLEKTAKYADDLTKFEATLSGQIEVSNAEIENQSVLVGTKLLPAQAMWNGLLVATYSALGELLTPLDYLNDALERSEGSWKRFMDAAKAAGDFALRFSMPLLNEVLVLLDIIEGFYDKYVGSPDKTFLGDYTGELIPQDIEGQSAQETDAQTGVLDDFAKILEYERTERRDAAIDLGRDLEEITRRSEEAITEIVEEEAEKRAKIGRDEKFELGQADDNYYLDREQMLRQFELEKAEQEQRANEQAIKRARDFQEAMRRLQEEYLFDLEDALRERDARAVIRLNKRYQLDLEQLKRKNALEAGEEATKNAVENSNLAARQAERLRQLEEEWVQRRQFIQEQAEKERQENAISAQLAREDEIEEANIARAERELRHQQEMQDLNVELSDRLLALVTAYEKELEITKEYADRIYTELFMLYGENGLLDKLYAYMYRRAADMEMSDKFLYATGYKNIRTNPSSANPELNWKNWPVPKFAEGGTMLATRPTLAMFGERGPEVASFTPVNKMGYNGGSMKLELWLSPDLEARVVDDAMGNLADVLMQRLT